MSDYLDHVNEKYGQGSRNTAPAQNNGSAQTDYLNHVREKYGVSAPVTQTAVSTAPEIPSVSNLTVNAVNSSETPNSSVLTDEQIIKNYESIPTYNFLQRLFSSEKQDAYKEKQAQYSDYKAAKTREVGKLVDSLGITEQDLALSNGSVMGQSVTGDSLDKYNLTDQQKKDIRTYAQDYFTEKANSAITDYTDKNAGTKALMTGVSFATNPVESMTDDIRTGIDYITGNPISKKTADVTQNIRDTVSEDMGTVGKFAYGTATSIGDMLVAAMLGKAVGGDSTQIMKKVSSALMGLEKASQTVDSATERGLTPFQTVTLAASSGATTALTESKVMERFGENLLKGFVAKEGDTVAKQLIKQIAKSFLAEGGQEVAEGALDIVADQIISNIASKENKSELNMQYQRYIDAGYSKEEALKKVGVDTVVAGFTDFIGGGIAGAGMELGTLGIGTALNATSLNKNDINLNNLTDVSVEEQAKIKALEEQLAKSESEAQTKTNAAEPVTNEVPTLSATATPEITPEVQPEQQNNIPGLDPLIAEMEAEREARIQQAMPEIRQSDYSNTSLSNEYKDTSKAIHNIVNMFGGEVGKAQAQNLYQLLNEYESTHSPEIAAQITQTVAEMEKQLQGSTYTNKKTNKRGTKQTIYNYPTNWGTITEIVNGLMEQMDSKSGPINNAGDAKSRISTLLETASDEAVNAYKKFERDLVAAQRAQAGGVDSDNAIYEIPLNDIDNILAALPANASKEMSGLLDIVYSEAMKENVSANTVEKNSQVDNNSTLNYANVEGESTNGTETERINTGTGNADNGRSAEIPSIVNNSGANEEARKNGQGNSGISGRKLVSNNISSLMDEAKVTDFGLQDTTPDKVSFSEQLSEAKKSHSKGYMVDAKTPEELKNAKLFTNPEKTAGVAIEPDGNIVGVHKNRAKDSRAGAVVDLIITARENGGTKMDCYGLDLVDMYISAGYKPVAVVDWNEKYRPADWPADDPGLPIYVLMKDSRTTQQVLEDMRSKKSPDYDLEALKHFDKDGYDDAKNYRDSLLSEQQKTETVNENSESTQEKNSYSNETVYKTDVPKEVLSELKTQYYTVAKNADTKANADSIIANNSVEDAYAIFSDLVEKKNPVAIPLGVELTKLVSAQQAVDIVNKMSAELTKAGQFTQAAAINLLKNSPEAALKYMQKSINKLNEEGKKKYHNKWKDFSLTTEEVDMLRNIKPGDTEAIQNAYDQISERVAKSYPTSMWEKVVEFSKLAMMFNVRTHLRNVAANTVMVPVSSLSDRVQALGENAYKLLVDDSFETTQSITGGNKAQKDIAAQIFADQIVDRLKETNEYSEINLKNKAERGKQVFKSSALGKAAKEGTLKFAETLNRITNGRLDEFVANLDETMTDSVIENLKNFDYYLLGEVEDDPFVKRRFVNRLASYMNAQNITDINNVPGEAIEIAFDEALKATFKDQNKFTQSMSTIKKSLGKVGDVLFPFTMTPANIAMRGLEYSPAGVVMAISQEIKANGMEGFNKVLTNPTFAKGLTGTAGILVGFLLSKAGIIKGALSGDKDEKEYEKQQGQLAYSVNINGNYVTFDWAQPAAIPLIIGTAIYDGYKEGEKDALSIVRQAAASSFDAWLDLSPLQTINDLFGGNGYGENSAGDNFIGELLEAPQRVIPSMLGAITRTGDTNIRNTTDNTSAVNTFVNQVKAKIPGLSDDLPSQYTTWGEERKRQGSTASAAFAQFLNPGQLGYDASTDIDADIQSLYDATGSKAVFPYKAATSYKNNDGENVKLNNVEYSELQKTMGQTSYEVASTFINSDYYNMVNNDVKVKVLSSIYSFAQSAALHDLHDKNMSSEDSKYYEIYKEQGAEGLVSYLATKSAVSDATNSSSKYADIIPALGSMDLTDEQRGQYIVDKSTEPAKAIQGFIDDGDYASVYNYYKIKTEADSDKNGSVSSDELIDYLKKSDYSLDERVDWYKNFFSTKKNTDIPRLW